MGTEQNLDEMLRSLQISVDNLSDGEDTVVNASEDYADISTSDLQKILEEKYFSEGATGKHESDGSYELDDDVLAQFIEEDEEDEEISSDETFVNEPVIRERVESSEEEIAIEESATSEIEELFDRSSFEEILAEPEKIVTADESDPFEELEREDASEQTESIERFETLEEFDPVEDPDVLDELEKLEFSEDTEEYDEPVSDYEEFDVIDTQTLLDDETFTVSQEPEITEPELVSMTDGDEGVETAFDPYSAAPVVEKPKSFKAMIMDYGRPDLIPPIQIEDHQHELQNDESEQETPDVGDILSDFVDDSPTPEEKMNFAVHEFMNSLGCEDELESVSAEDIGAIYGQFGEEETEESGTVSSEHIEKKRNGYKKSTLVSALKLTACAVLTFIMFFYDTLPIFDVDFLGLSDYVQYPSAYVMIGAQLLLICAAVMWRDIWNGIKGLLTVYPNIYSMVAVIVCSCVFYDTVFFITGSYKPLQTPMFHFLCGVFLTVVSLYSLLMVMRESATYNIYTADVAKFTLTRDKSAHSVGGKMYSGGFSKEKRVYTPSAVLDPKGFSDAIAEEGSFYNGVYSSLILISVGVGVIFGIILLIAGRSIDEGSIAAMSTVMALMPISAVAAIFVPVMISYLRLRKRGIALTGRKMIRKYGAKNAIVFSDLHLFSKCDPKQIGFVCYEKLQTKNVLSALNILYSRIGGPMGEVFSNIPEEYRAKTVRVRRITRNGVEAVVDRSHVLLVGDMDFMRRYGIEFSVAGSNINNDSIYVSLDGRASARLMAVYKVEPVFDMLIERLAAEGVHCVIETYDPMINTAFAARHRKRGRTPISVVHKNAADINRPQGNAQKRSDHGLLALSSRLKLAEAVVWCARLCGIEKLLNISIYVSIGLGLVAIGVTGALGLIPCGIQYLFFAYMLLVFALVTVLTITRLPRKDYFTVDALANEDNIREINERKKNTNEQKHK